MAKRTQKLEKDLNVPEFKLSQIDDIHWERIPKIDSSRTAVELLSIYIGQKELGNQINVNEFAFVIYTNQRLKVLGITNLAIGGIDGTVLDVRLIFAQAVLLGATGIIVAHNHPTGNLFPSDADKRMAKQLKEGSRLLSIKLLDFMIITSNSGYYSFVDQNEESMYAKGGEIAHPRINWSEYYEHGGSISNMPPTDDNGELKIDDESIRELTEYVTSLPQTKAMYFNEATGQYSPERKQLHAEIINSYKDDVVCITEGRPIAILMGGSPASGKSSFLRKYSPYLLQDEILRVDADDIRAKLPEYKGYNATQTHLETKDIVNTLISDRVIGIPCDFDLIYDGTMNSVRSYLPLIDILKKRGYLIFIVYMDNVPKDVIIDRILKRYQKTGRFVPLEVVEDFYQKGRVAFDQLKNKVDGYMVIDGNSFDYPIIEQGGMELPQERAYSMLGYPIPKETLPKEYAKGGKMAEGGMIDKYLSSQKEMFTSFDDALSKKDVIDFIAISKNSDKKYWIKGSDGYSYFLYKGQLRANDSTSGIFKATKISIDRLKDTLKYKIREEDLFDYEKEMIAYLDEYQNIIKPKPIENDWTKYVKENKSYFSVEEETENIIQLATRQNGNVGDEKASSKDIKEAKEIFKKVKSKYPNTKGSIETVDEWVYLELENGIMAKGGEVDDDYIQGKKYVSEKHPVNYSYNPFQKIHFANIKIPLYNRGYEIGTFMIEGSAETKKKAYKNLQKEYDIYFKDNLTYIKNHRTNFNGVGDNTIMNIYGMPYDRYVITFGFKEDDGEYKTDKSRPIPAMDEDEAAEKLIDQFRSFEGIRPDIISIKKLSEGGMMAKGGEVGKKLPPIILKKLQEKLTISKKAINKWGGEYYDKFPQLIKDQIDGKTPFTYENHLMVQGDEKKDHYDIFIENNAIELAKKIKKIVDKYKNKEVSNTSIPSAPNSSSFMASISGKIELVVNFIHYGGYYSGNNNLLIGVKIGNGIDPITQKKIKQDMYEVMFPYDQYNSSDGGVMWFNTSGTNYDTIGLECNTLRFSDSLAEKIENIFNSKAYAKGGKMAKGGVTGYERLVKKVAANYEGKAVPSKYRSKYGKRYDADEAKKVGYAVATKVYGKPLARMAEGGEISMVVKKLLTRLNEAHKNKNDDLFDSISNKIHEISDQNGLTQKEYEIWDDLRERNNQQRLDTFLNKNRMAEGGETDSEITAEDRMIERQHTIELPL